MARIIMMFLRNLFLLPGAWIRLMRQSHHPERYTMEQQFELFRHIVSMANRGGNVRLESTGAEKLPKEDGFIMFPNHQGMYDALAIIGSSGRTFQVVSKKEVQNVPLLKNVFQADHALFIDREDIRQSLGIINEAAEIARKGGNILIFPEGTRSRKGNEMNEFKPGCFKCAVKAKCQIVPVALLNSFVPFDSKSLRQVTVQVHYLDPIPYEEYKGMKTTEIAAMVHDRIENCIREHNK